MADGNYEKEEVPVRMQDGTKSRITVFRHQPANCLPVILCLPALGVAARFYEPLALTILEKGWNAATADLRGNGHSSVRASKEVNFGYHKMITYDWPAVIAGVRTSFPQNPLFLLGHSLGGQLSALYLSLNSENVSGLILVAAPSVFYKGWGFPKNLGLLAGTRLVRWIADLWGYFPGEIFGFAGTEAKQVMKDWARNASTGRYDIAGSPHDFEKLLAELKLPVLAVSFEGDFFAPKQAVQNLCDKMKGCAVSRLHLTKEEMEVTALNHFNWVKYSHPLVKKIQAWVQQKGGTPHGA